jgi:hypothetical protein
MSQSILRFVRILFVAILGATVLYTSNGSVSAAARSRTDQGERTVTRDVRVVLTADRDKFSLEDSVTINVAIQNDGPDPVYIYRKLAWGYGGGLVLHIQDEQGAAVKPATMDDTLIPPPPPGVPAIFVRLDEGQFFGTRRLLRLKDMLPRAGKYTWQVDYQSPLSRKFVDVKLRGLAALWHEDPSVHSNSMVFEVER